MKKQYITEGLLKQLFDVNSCALLSEDKVKGIVKLNNAYYVAVSTSSSGDRGMISVSAYECTLKEFYIGSLSPLFYNDHHYEVQKGTRERGYDGRMFKKDGHTYVMHSPVIFYPIKNDEQIQLF